MLRCYRNPNRYSARKGHSGTYSTWGWHVKSQGLKWKRLFLSLSPAPIAPPSLKLLLLNNQQSLFLLLTFAHSFSHHLSFLTFILYGQSLSLPCSSTPPNTSSCFTTPSLFSSQSPPLINLLPSPLLSLLFLWVTVEAAAAMLPSLEMFSVYLSVRLSVTQWWKVTTVSTCTQVVYCTLLRYMYFILWYYSTPLHVGSIYCTFYSLQLFDNISYLCRFKWLIQTFDYTTWCAIMDGDAWQDIQSFIYLILH